MTTAYATPQRTTITEGDTFPYQIDYRHQPDDPSTATTAELVAWSLLDRSEVMRSAATVAALSVEADGTHRGTVSAPVTYLSPGVYGVQAELSMPDASLWRVPAFRHSLHVVPGPGGAAVPDAPATTDLSVTLTVAGNDFAFLDPIRYDTTGGAWVRSSTANPFETELIVTDVDGDTVTAQGSGAFTVTGGHGEALGPRWLGSGIPAITATLPTSGAIERLLQVVTAEVILVNIGVKVGF